MIVFLVGIGLFAWVFPGNILETGSADLAPLFSLAPWLFLFLIPAITMRSFSEEFKTGTIEFLMTKPTTEWGIILGKYCAAIFLVFCALLPTFVYFVTIYTLGYPPGNVDVGATIGSYLGLFGLGCVFASIGIFSSSVTDNQIVAFILGVFLSYFFYSAFDFIAELETFGDFNDYVLRLGINEHYRSISRGVVDSRDVLYYFSFIFLTLLACKFTLSKRKK